jgi:hypothetical protein
MSYANFCDSLAWKNGATLITATVDSVEEPDWLLTLLRDVCRNKNNTVICNLKVIVLSSLNEPVTFDMESVEFVQSYCSSSQADQSVELLSSLATIRDPPTDEAQEELAPLKSSLRTGWKNDHVVICSSDGKVLLDGATRVFLLNSMRSQGIDVPSKVPVVTCLPCTPAWIINAMLVSLSESADRRIWSPSDTLNLASYQVESLRSCEQKVKSTAYEKMRTMKVFHGFREFIDLAIIVNSRTICSDLARHLSLKKGSLCFFNILSTKAAVDNCKKIVAGSAFTHGSCEKGFDQFFTKLKVEGSGSKSAKVDSTVVSNACNDVFSGFQTESLKYGIHVAYKLALGTERSVNLKWCPKTFRHQSNSHYVCASSQYSRFEIRIVNSNVLIATKLVPSLVPALGCMQGTALWLIERPDQFTELRVTALQSEVLFEDHCCLEPEAVVPASNAQLTSPVSIPHKRPRSQPLSMQVDKGWKPFLTEILKYELWLSMECFDYNTLWRYIAAKGSDIPSFVVKMEARLRSLCLLHADLYRDTRFNDLGLRLITDARKIQQGFKPSPEQLTLLHRFCDKYGWFLTPVLWNHAELLFLLVYVFDPRLRFVHVIQKDAKSSIENRQNRGMALCSKFLSQLLFQRLKEFGLVSNSHQPGDAVVLDSNGSHLQHFQSRRTTDFFKALFPLPFEPQLA